MARILSIDYGKKRTGIAVTDPLQIIATGLTTLETDAVIFYLKQYFKTEIVEKVIIGYPLALDNTATDATHLVDKFLKNFSKVFPEMKIETVGEQYTSQRAVAAMIDMGMKKSDRKIKGNIDELSATMMLQEYLAAQS